LDVHCEGDQDAAPGKYSSKISETID
jgi:hypothetical protein